MRPTGTGPCPPSTLPSLLPMTFHQLNVSPYLACAFAPVRTPPPPHLLRLEWVSPLPGSPDQCLSSAGPQFTVDTGATAAFLLSPLGWGRGLPYSWPGLRPQHGLSTEQTLRSDVNETLYGSPQQGLSGQDPS